MKRHEGCLKSGGAWFLVIGFAWAGCGGTEGPPAGAPTDEDVATEPDVVEGTDVGDDDVVGDAVAVGVFPPLSAFSNYCAGDEECSGDSTCMPVDGEDGGLCIVTPEGPSLLTDPFDEDLSDVATAPACVGLTLEPTGTETVDLYGIVDRFGSGGVTRDVQIRVFLADGFTPEQCDPLAGAAKSDCYEALFSDPTLLLGQTVSVLPPEATGVCKNKSCEYDSECPLGYACEGATGQEECTLAFGLYTLEDVPANIPLVVMTRKTKELDDWHDTFLFNTVFDVTVADADGGYRYDPITVSHGQWQTVPNPFGVSIGVGNGAVGGRLRDCVGDHLGWYIYEGTVSFAELPAKIGYFNDKESNTLPDPFRAKTNLFGRFTGLDVAPGPNWVMGAYGDGEEVQTLGAYRFYVFPNGLSVVSFPGTAAAVTQLGVDCEGETE